MPKGRPRAGLFCCPINRPALDFRHGCCFLVTASATQMPYIWGQLVMKIEFGAAYAGGWLRELGEGDEDDVARCGEPDCRGDGFGTSGRSTGAGPWQGTGNGRRDL